MHVHQGEEVVEVEEVAVVVEDLAEGVVDIEVDMVVGVDMEEVVEGTVVEVEETDMVVEAWGTVVVVMVVVVVVEGNTQKNQFNFSRKE